MLELLTLSSAIFASIRDIPAHTTDPLQASSLKLEVLQRGETSDFHEEAESEMLIF